MNPRIMRLQQLLQMKKESTKQVYLEVLKAQEQFKQNKTRHEQLVSYRKDYVLQLEVIANEGSTVGRLRNRMDFITHLDTALIQLNGHLAQLAKQRAQAELDHKQAKLSEESVNQLIERVRRTEELKIKRKEQKESDEYAQKQWYSKNIKNE